VSLLAAAGLVSVAGGLVVTSLGSVDFLVREPVRRADEGRWLRSMRLTTLRVCGPTMPSAASPLSDCKRRTALSVSGPKRPSTPGRPRL
jgi:hypothetical protein